MHIEKSTRATLQELIVKHAKTVLAPMDDMWENMIIPSGTYYSIQKETTIGYFILDANDMLIQLFIEEDYKWEYPVIFDKIFEEQKVSGALAGTYEPEFLSFCLDRSTQQEIDTILYQAVPSPPLVCPIDDVELVIALMDHYEQVLEFCESKVGLQGEWMQPYYQNLLPQESVYLFKKDDEIIGIGELRPSSSSPAFANLGIMVSQDFRKKQLGSYIMNQMKNRAKRKGLFGICSTTTDNIASQKAIQKAGLMPYHRILKIDF